MEFLTKISIQSSTIYQKFRWRRYGHNEPWRGHFESAFWHLRTGISLNPQRHLQQMQFSPELLKVWIDHNSVVLISPESKPLWMIFRSDCRALLGNLHPVGRCTSMLSILVNEILWPLIGLLGSVFLLQWLPVCQILHRVHNARNIKRKNGS